MAVRQYIGARYVPKFFEGVGGSSDWVSGIPYEPLTIVTYLGTSFTSKKAVPATVGAPNENPDYWVVTGNYNAQVEEYRQMVEGYRQEVEGFDGRITTVEDELTDVDTKVTTLEGGLTDVNAKVATVEGGLSAEDNGNSQVAVNAYSEGTIIWWNGEMFRATVDIASGETLEEGTNVEKFELSSTLMGIDEEIEKLRYKDFGIRMAYYVNAQSGDDNNDGKSSDSPFKTIEKAYQTSLENNYADVNIHLESPGEYLLNDRRITNLSMHILGRTSGITLKLGDGINYTPYIYNCYLHIEGLSASDMMVVYAPRGLHGNTSFYYFKWCELKTDDGYDIGSDKIAATEIAIDANVRIVCTNGFLNIQGQNIIKWRPGAVTQGAGQFVFAQNAFVALFGTWTYTPLSANVPAETWMFDFQHCVVSMQNRFADLSSNGYKFTNHAVRLRYCWATFRDLVKNDIKNTSLADTNIPDGGYSTMLGSNGNEWVR